MKSDPENLKAIVGAVLTWLVKSRWRRSIFAVVSIIKRKYLFFFGNYDYKNKIVCMMENKLFFVYNACIVFQTNVSGYLHVSCSGMCVCDVIKKDP